MTRALMRKPILPRRMAAIRFRGILDRLARHGCLPTICGDYLFPFISACFYRNYMPTHEIAADLAL